MHPQTRIRAYSVPRFHSFRRSGHVVRYGLRQESELRRGLSMDTTLRVDHDQTEDAIYKMDAIVRFLDAPLLPAVGIQFTTKADPDKVKRTIAAVRRSRIVSRLLYLEAEYALTAAVFPMITDLIRVLAGSPADRAIICAVLTGDGHDRYWFRDLKCHPLETAVADHHNKQEKAA